MVRSRKRRQDPASAQTVMETSLGPIFLFFSDKGLVGLSFAGENDLKQGVSPGRTPATPAPTESVLKTWQQQVAQALKDYFAGKPVNIESLPLDLQGSPFLLKVWQEMKKIPHGATLSYKDLATRIGNPKAARAVGQAVGANPIPILIPCHRVINADGSLGGFSSGLDRKEWLLRHEKAI
jgi:O-6-methylguanine DNA methyltransferase